MIANNLYTRFHGSDSLHICDMNIFSNEEKNACELKRKDKCLQKANIEST